MYMDGPSNQCASFLNDTQSIEAATLKAIVRGERAVKDATRLWISVRQSGGTTDSDHLSQAVCASDLAEGIVKLKDDPVALEELANAIVAVSGLLSFEDELSDRLISCVWNLALGEPIGERTIRLANAVRSRLCETAPAPA